MPLCGDLNVTEEIHSPTYAAARFRGRRALVVFLAVVLCCAAVWVNRMELLRGAADLWVVSDNVGPADAVVIFGGGLNTRPFAAAKYYREGFTNKILVSNVGLDRAEVVGGVPSHAALNRRILLKLGVPETAIKTFGSGLSNTHQEAVALRRWAVSHHASTVIVPTEDFSSRRVRWIVTHELAGTGIQVEVPALDNTKYGVENWWKDEKAIVDFQNEVLKYVYYRLKY